MFLFFLTEKLLKTGPSLWDGLKPSHFHIHRQLVEYVDTLCTVKLSECFMCEDQLLLLFPLLNVTCSKPRPGDIDT